MDEPFVVHVFGASGAGTSTLGRAMRDAWGFAHLDTDDYFWLPTDPPYTAPREQSERLALIQAGIGTRGNCALTGSLCGWGDTLIPLFGLAVFLDTPTEVRIRRLRERELMKFGARILPGGDMYTNHEEFIEWAKTYDTAGLDSRSRALHEAWMGNLGCPVVRADGTLPVRELLETIGSEMWRLKP